jgi:hypothetical protein
LEGTVEFKHAEWLSSLITEFQSHCFSLKLKSNINSRSIGFLLRKKAYATGDQRIIGLVESSFVLESTEKMFNLDVAGFPGIARTANLKLFKSDIDVDWAGFPVFWQKCVEELLLSETTNEEEKLECIKYFITQYIKSQEEGKKKEFHLNDMDNHVLNNILGEILFAAVLKKQKKIIEWLMNLVILNFTGLTIFRNYQLNLFAKIHLFANL